eukprot:Anaeramoba_ignava/c17705_g1_i1.p1 GENE.c17705_g1_i1~~c17705_g1_i1.p1  ORF type:complete len:511 (-),score=87.04 c17705_g1_i1:116-1648(-)
MSCARCQVYIDEKDLPRLPPMSQQEQDALTHAYKPNPRSRLACGLVLDTNTNGLSIDLAPLKPKKIRKKIQKPKETSITITDSSVVSYPFSEPFLSLNPDSLETVENYQTVKIKEGIHWCGVIDWDLRDFHGYRTTRGGTYNSYFIQDEESVLIDTVKQPFVERYLKKVKSLVNGDLKKIKYLVCQHVEMDHSSALPSVMQACPHLTVVCTELCKQVLEKHYDISQWKFKIVADGETLKLGKRSLTFVATPLVHWPESIVTYMPEEKILFSMDAFGQHYATTKRFDDEVDFSIVLDEMKIYYANILMRLSVPIKKALKNLGTLDISTICPSHGVVFRQKENISKIIEKYTDWANFKKKPHVILFYDTMYKSTQRMINEVAAGIKEVSGVTFDIMNVRTNHITDIATGALDCAALVVGSPVFQEHSMPEVICALSYLEALRPLDKLALIVSSYGWSQSGAANDISRYLDSIKAKQIRDPIFSFYRPTNSLLKECRDAGKQLALEVKKVCNI